MKLSAGLMFKVLVLQAFCGVSDEQAEYQLRDRLSFMRFLGLGLSERVPVEKTIWLFRELLVRAGAIDKLFDRFAGHLEAELSSHVGADRRCLPGGHAQAAQQG
jgi:IS5 family transposase